MCDWMAASAGLLEPIVMAMTLRVLASKVIGTDDTPVTVQDHAGKGSKTGRLWVYLGDRDNPFVIYDYTPDRSRDGPERFLRTTARVISSPTPMPDTTAGTGGPRRGRLLGRCAAEVSRGSHQRPGAVARGDRLDQRTLRRGTRGTRWGLGRGAVDGRDAPSDRGRSWSRSGRGWRVRRRRSCRKAQWVRRSPTPGRTGSH